MKTNEAKNTVAGINEVIARRVSEIRSLVEMGWTLNAAIENVRNSSTLGPKSWEAIMAEVGPDAPFHFQPYPFVA